MSRPAWLPPGTPDECPIVYRPPEARDKFKGPLSQKWIADDALFEAYVFTQGRSLAAVYDPEFFTVDQAASAFAEEGGENEDYVMWHMGAVRRIIFFRDGPDGKPTTRIVHIE